jgi:hypothetical protein
VPLQDLRKKTTEMETYTGLQVELLELVPGELDAHLAVDAASALDVVSIDGVDLGLGGGSCHFTRARRAVEMK